MKSKFATCAACVIATSAAFGATSTLVLNDEFTTGVPQNLSNLLGVATNGLKWGLLIDTSGNGFVASDVNLYDNIALTSGTTYSLSVSSVSTGDVLIMSSGLTADTSGSLEVDASTPGGIGGVIQDITVDYDYGGTIINQNDPFYLVWFDGNKGGILGDPVNWLLPASGSTGVSAGQPFLGVDPNRWAGLAYSGTSGTSTGFGIEIAAIPEPSTALLAAFGSLALLRRRRN